MESRPGTQSESRPGTKPYEERVVELGKRTIADEHIEEWWDD